MNLPWKTKGIVLTAPLSHEIDDVVKFIDEYLAPNGCNLICLHIRYRYRFKRHPECMGYDPLSFDDVKKLAAMDIYGAIIGKAYYTGAINLSEAAEAVK